MHHGKNDETSCHLMGRNWTLLQENNLPTFEELFSNFKSIFLLEEPGYDFGLFAILSTPKKSLRVR